MAIASDTDVSEGEEMAEENEVPAELLDELLKNCKSPEDLLGKNGLLKQLSKGLLERMLEAEMSDHLGYDKHAVDGHHSGNSRNGKSNKTVTTDSGDIKLQVPRDRQGEFDPIVVAKGQRRLPGFDEKVMSLYARGMTTREIQGHLEDLYGIDISPTLISQVTAAVLDEVVAWQNRPLDAVYPIVYLDALWVKIRTDRVTQNQAVYLALGVNLEGEKELLGLWIAQNEGAKFWLSVLTELKNRGVQDIFIACVDGLKGFPDAIESEFPKTQVQVCVVHQIRNSLNLVTWTDRKEVARDLKEIYTAATADEARANLDAFAQKWDGDFPMISKSWIANWDRLCPFFDYPPEIRKAIYTTNAIESLNRSLRKIIKNRGAFPNEDAAKKLLFMALQNIAKKWNRPIHNWQAALNRFAIMFEGRVPLS
jgi:putative transposase